MQHLALPTPTHLIIPTMLNTSPALALAAILCLYGLAKGQSAVSPAYKSTHVLAHSSESGTQNYLAFPALLDLGEDLLISFKRGRSHAADADAALECLRIGRQQGDVLSRSEIAAMPGQIMQMGEWVRFPNGDIANYIDAQRPTAPSRIGLRFVRSQDGGHNFGPVERVGKIDGVEYGYAFESITRDQSTWMLVMTFANLDGGGEPVFGAGSQPGTVDVIRSDDNGTNWRFVANITRELGGAPINESSFVPYGDGFLVAARGYDRQQWLLRTDSDFKLLHRVDLASTHPFIRSSLGRPRVFTHDGGWYLLARNTLEPGATVAEGVKGNPMRLSLFEFDPLSLMITRHFVLDNAEGENVADGYYAVPYWHERDGKEYLSVITYKRLNASGPDLIRLEFDWSEFQ